jgi:hypothetical protein
VQVVADGKTYTAELNRAGKARIRLDRFESAGTQSVEVSYLGDDETAPSATTVEIQVRSRPGHGNGHGHGHGHGNGHGH